MKYSICVFLFCFIDLNIPFNLFLNPAILAVYGEQFFQQSGHRFSVANCSDFKRAMIRKEEKKLLLNNVFAETDERI